MTKKTISELDDIGTNQEPGAVVAIEQNGATFKGPVRPNPPEQLNVTSQAQLETAFGIDIEIPDNTTVVIVLDEGFNLSKPIKFGDGCNVEIYGSTPNTILNIIGAFGAVFQNTNPSDVAQELNFHNFKVIGSTGNILFDLKVTAVVKMRDMEIIDIDDLGILEAGAIGFDTLFFVDVIKGLIIKNPQIVRLSTTAIQNFSSPVFTFLSFILENPGTIILDGITAFGFSTGDELLFLDPNAPAGSNFIIEKSSVDGGDFYQQGVSEAITVVADNGSGKIRCTAAAHGLKDGQVAVLHEFLVQTQYNGTFQITVIDANTFDVEDVDFVADDQGGVIEASLDQKDNRVNAKSNPGQPDSMFLAEGRGVGTILVDSIQNTLVPIVDITPVSGDFIQDVATERFTVDTTTGIITYTGLEPITVLVSYELNTEKSGGADQNLIISLEINGTPQTKSDLNLLATAAPGTFGTSNRKIYAIVTGNTFQLFLNNTTNGTDTNVTKLSLVISRQ